MYGSAYDTSPVRRAVVYMLRYDIVLLSFHVERVLLQYLRWLVYMIVVDHHLLRISATTFAHPDGAVTHD